MPNTQESIENTGGIPEIEFEMLVSGMTQTAVDPTLTVPGMAADAKATGDAIGDANANIADLFEAVEGLNGKTGEDIKLTSEEESPTVAEAILNAFGNTWPVGSVFITESPELPEVIASLGEWKEISVPLTWGDIRTGTRSYEETEEGFVPGMLHFWLRKS